MDPIRARYFTDNFAATNEELAYINSIYPRAGIDLEETGVLLSEILSNSRKKELIEAIKYIRPDLLENTEAFEKAAVGMELSVDVLGFVPEE